MADDQGDKGGSGPQPKFYFSVQLGDDRDVRFSEVSGLEADMTPIEYRHGDSNPIKMPGLGSVGNVITMRKGVFVKNAKFWTWFSDIKINLIMRRTVVILLMDETGDSKMAWTLHNAWPVKVTGTDLKSEGNEVAVESIELAYETLEVKAA